MHRIYSRLLLVLSFIGLSGSAPGRVSSGQPVRQTLTVRSPTLAEDALFIDGAQEFQTIDGFGVNANGASWGNGNLAPALDLLADTMRVRIWRVILEKADWEATNDNADPFVFNWDYYNTVYSSPKFQSLWNIIAYLNHKGNNQVMLDVMGTVPAWMGGNVIDPNAEDEWVEMIASAVYYGRKIKGLDFRLLSPTNEVDIGPPEGPQVSPDQYARLINKLVSRLQALGLTDITIVPPDIALVQQAPAYLTPLFADPTIMAHVSHLSFHDYGGNAGNVDSLIRSSAYPDRNFWMTEFSSGCSGCDTGTPPPDQWAFGAGTFDMLLQFLNQGAASTLVYEAYDSYYEHHGSFSYWGMLSYDPATCTYTPTKRFYAMAQAFRFTQPGMVRIGATSSNNELQLVAFKDPATGQVTLVGRNPTADARLLYGTFANLSITGTLALYQTTPWVNLDRGADVPVTGNTFSVQIEPYSIFTLSNLAINQPGTSQGALIGDAAIESNVDTNPTGMAEAFQYTAAASGTVNQISLYLDASNMTTQVVVGLYTNGSDDNPGSLLTQATIDNPTAGSWNTVSVPATAVTAGVKYWIAVLSPVGAGTVQFRDVVSGGKSQTSFQQDLSNLPITWTPGTTYTSSPMSAYALQATVDNGYHVFLPLAMSCRECQ